ncbi:MAG: hypothetical protein IPH30_04315 [Betaproteobacteria bacterium]|nr:hypothetical protein [Betaproteobacteria bacterium]
MVENSYRITGSDREEGSRSRRSGTKMSRLKRDLEAARASVAELERQVAIDKAAQNELARNVTQLQDENAALKEDLGFLRNIMSSGTTPRALVSRT